MSFGGFYSLICFIVLFSYDEEAMLVPDNMLDSAFRW